MIRRASIFILNHFYISRKMIFVFKNHTDFLLSAKVFSLFADSKYDVERSFS